MGIVTTDKAAFEPGELIQIYLNGFKGGFLGLFGTAVAISIHGTSVARDIADVQTDIYGNATHNWIAFSDLQPGSYTIVAVPLEGASDTFPVTVLSGGDGAAGEIQQAYIVPSSVLLNQPFRVEALIVNTGTVPFKFHIRATYNDTGDNLVKRVSSTSYDLLPGADATAKTTEMFATKSGTIIVELRGTNDLKTYATKNVPISPGGTATTAEVIVTDITSPASVSIKALFNVTVSVKEVDGTDGNFKLIPVVNNVKQIGTGYPTPQSSPITALASTSKLVPVTAPTTPTSINVRVICETFRNGVWVETGTSATKTIVVEDPTQSCPTGFHMEDGQCVRDPVVDGYPFGIDPLYLVLGAGIIGAAFMLKR